MGPQEAAERLRREIGAPSGYLSVLAWHGDDRVVLIVQVAPQYNIDLNKIPQEYKGYKVEVERRKRPVPYRSSLPS